MREQQNTHEQKDSNGIIRLYQTIKKRSTKNWKEKDLQSPPLYLQTSPPYDSPNKAYASTPHKKGREHLDLVKIK